MQFQNLGEFFKNRCSVFEKQVALRFHRKNEVVDISYQQLGTSALEMGIGLYHLGFRAGDRCCFFAQNSPAFVVLLMAVHMRSGLDVTIHPELPPEEMLGLLEEAECNFLVTDDRSLIGFLKAKNSGISIIYPEWDKPPEAGVYSLDDLQRTSMGQLEKKVKERLRFQWKKRLRDDPATIIFKNESKSSHSVRGVVLTHRNILRGIESLASVIPSTELDSLLTSFSLRHSSGRTALFFTFWHGGALMLSERADFFKNMEEWQPSLAMTSPEVLRTFHKSFLQGGLGDSLFSIILRRLYSKLTHSWGWSTDFLMGDLPRFRFESLPTDILLKVFAVGLYCISLPLKILGGIFLTRGIRKTLGKNLRAIYTGGSGLTRKTVNFYKAQNVVLMESYWLTEAGHTVACSVLEFTGQTDRTITGTVGPVLPGVELKLINQRGEDVTNIPGTTGAIFVRGEQIMQGYFKKPDATKAVFDAGGWLRTGDFGRLTLTGELQILGAWGRR